VGADQELHKHILANLPVTASGYLYIYTSNETENVDVFFDNLQVTQVRGPLLEEDHYYPFGLSMAGISDKALKGNYAENKIRFQKQELQNKEFSDGSGLEMYEFKYRFDDPQTGRFWSIDPLASQYEYNSPYAFSEDKVISHVELEGLEATPISALWGAVKAEIQGAANWVDSHLSFNTDTKVSTPVTANGVNTGQSVVVDTKTTTTPNLGPNASYVMVHNTNAGNPASLTKTDVKVTVAVETKAEVKTPVGSGSYSQSTNNNGETTRTASGDVKTKALSVGASGSTNSNGNTSVQGSVSASAGTTTTRATVTVNTNSNGQTNVQMGGSVEHKVGPVKITNSASVTIGHQQN
jgi:RHS repeat-associated protein